MSSTLVSVLRARPILSYIKVIVNINVQVQFQSSRVRGFNFRVVKGQVKRIGSVFNEGVKVVGVQREDQLMIRDEVVVAPGSDREPKFVPPMSRIAFPANGFK